MKEKKGGKNNKNNKEKKENQVNKREISKQKSLKMPLTHCHNRI